MVNSMTVFLLLLVISSVTLCLCVLYAHYFVYTPPYLDTNDKIRVMGTTTKTHLTYRLHQKNESTSYKFPLSPSYLDTNDKIRVEVTTTERHITYRLHQNNESTSYKLPLSHLNFTRHHQRYSSFNEALAGQTKCRTMKSLHHPVSEPVVVKDIKNGEMRVQDSIYKETNDLSSADDQVFSKGGRKTTTHDLSRSSAQVMDQSQRQSTIILAVVDLGYIEMAINLYISSLLRHQLHNYLFICSERVACDILNSLDISAYLYVDYKDIGRKSSLYRSKAFMKKTHVKTMSVLDALIANYSVLITDVDIVFLKNPLHHIPQQEYDIQISWDETEGNSGFYLARNTHAAITLHKEAMALFTNNSNLNNQKTVYRMLTKMSKSKQLKYGILDKSQFPNGYRYYELGYRLFHSDLPCPSCVIVHNNWIFGSSAKIYRFKELHQWFVNENHYYTSLDRGYITYRNPHDFSDQLFDMEYNALKSAFWIAHVLNRTLILPQFHKPRGCKYKVCSGDRLVTFNAVYHLASLDKYLGSNTYRESTFLENPLVPEEVRDTRVDNIVIMSKTVKDVARFENIASSQIFLPLYPAHGSSLNEIRKWFQAFHATRVLHFHSLYGAVNLEAASKVDPKFARKLDSGIKVADYRQVESGSEHRRRTSFELKYLSQNPRSLIHMNSGENDHSYEVQKVERSKTGISVTYILHQKNKITSYMFPLSHLNFTRRHQVYLTFEEALAGQTNRQIRENRMLDASFTWNSPINEFKNTGRKDELLEDTQAHVRQSKDAEANGGPNKDAHISDRLGKGTLTNEFGTDNNSMNSNITHDLIKDNHKRYQRAKLLRRLLSTRVYGNANASKAQRLNSNQLQDQSSNSDASTSLENILLTARSSNSDTQTIKLKGSNQIMGPSYAEFLQRNNSNEDGKFEGMTSNPLHTERDERNKFYGQPTIILAVVDLGYIEMAINLYISSLLRHQLHNYLFVCSERVACDILNSLDISAYLYVDYKDVGKEASSYFSNKFKVKTDVKTRAILDALNANHSVLITDVDIVFIKNPFNHMPCQDCDIQISSDVIEGNSGFYLAKNTHAAKVLHQGAMALYEKHPELSNQKTLDRTMEEMSKTNQLTYKMLDQDTFQNGYNYYEKGHRMWYSDFPCTSCVIVHNNWIVSNSAKIYRFKEHHHWFVDRNEYYTSPDRGYITYSNPAMFPDTFYTEYQALKSAFWIAHILKRTLIFPQFHKPRACTNEVCYGHDFVTFNAIYSVINLDKHLGMDSYRESSFLENPLVPKEVTDSVSESLLIKTSTVEEKKSLLSSVSKVFKPHSSSAGASVAEIRQWFRPLSNTRVLHFKALYGAVDFDTASEEDSEFAQKLESAILTSDYRQYKAEPVMHRTTSWMTAVTASGTKILLVVVPIFVVPCLCLAVCYKTGMCDMEAAEEYERRLRTIRRYRRANRR